MNLISKQESSPAWTQEAHRPSRCSLCCSVSWVEGEVPRVLPPPSTPGWGVPQVPTTIQTWDGVPPPSRPEMGYPSPRPEMGYPSPRPGMGYPPDLRLGTLYLDLGWGNPQSPPPPRKCGQTENISSRHPSDAGGKNKKSKYKISFF